MVNTLNNIETQFIFLKEICETDLQAIIDLRRYKSNNHLTPISSSIEDQIAYYNIYKIKRSENSEIYYKILDKNHSSNVVGLVRLTEINHTSKFSWESLIVADGAPPFISLDAMMTIYRIGFEKLGRDFCGPWTIPIDAKNIRSLHEKVGMAQEVRKDEKYYYMVVTKESFKRRYDFFRKIGYGVYNL